MIFEQPDRARHRHAVAVARLAIPRAFAAHQNAEQVDRLRQHRRGRHQDRQHYVGDQTSAHPRRPAKTDAPRRVQHGPQHRQQLGSK